MIYLKAEDVEELLRKCVQIFRNWLWLRRIVPLGKLKAFEWVLLDFIGLPPEELNDIQNSIQTTYELSIVFHCSETTRS